MSTDRKSIDWYNQNAVAYTAHVRDQSDSLYHSLYEKPAMYSLLPDVHKKKYSVSGVEAVKTVTT